MFLPASSIAFLFSPDFCLKEFDLTRRLILFFISASLASAVESLISTSAMVCSCRFFFLDWHSSCSMHFFCLSLPVRSYPPGESDIFCRASVQNVSSSFDIRSTIWLSCCLMPSYALRIAINESYCMLLLRMSLFSENPLSTHDCPCEKNSAYSSLFPICSLKNMARLLSFELYEQNVCHEGLVYCCNVVSITWTWLFSLWEISCWKRPSNLFAEDFGLFAK